MKISAFVLIVLLASLTNTVFAHDYKVGSLEILHPWARATPKGAPVAGGYLTITNQGSTPDRLVSTSASFAKRVEFHQMKLDGDLMRMRPISGGLEIKPGETVEFKPDVLHVMFIQPNMQLKPGDTFMAILQFEKAGSVEVEFNVESMGAKSPTAPKDHMH